MYIKRIKKWIKRGCLVS